MRLDGAEYFIRRTVFLEAQKRVKIHSDPKGSVNQKNLGTLAVNPSSPRPFQQLICKTERSSRTLFM